MAENWKKLFEDVGGDVEQLLSEYEAEINETFLMTDDGAVPISFKLKIGTTEDGSISYSVDLSFTKGVKVKDGKVGVVRETSLEDFIDEQREKSNLQIVGAE